MLEEFTYLKHTGELMLINSSEFFEVKNLCRIAECHIAVVVFVSMINNKFYFKKSLAQTNLIIKRYSQYLIGN